MTTAADLVLMDVDGHTLTDPDESDAGGAGDPTGVVVKDAVDAVWAAVEPGRQRMATLVGRHRLARTGPTEGTATARTIPRARARTTLRATTAPSGSSSPPNSGSRRTGGVARYAGDCPRHRRRGHRRDARGVRGGGSGDPTSPDRVSPNADERA